MTLREAILTNLSDANIIYRRSYSQRELEEMAALWTDVLYDAMSMHKSSALLHKAFLRYYQNSQFFPTPYAIIELMGILAPVRHRVTPPAAPAPKGYGRGLYKRLVQGKKIRE